MKKYSNDLRERAIKMLLEQKESQVNVARLLSVDKATVYRWVVRFRKTGDYGLAPQKKAGRKNKISDQNLPKFKEFISKNSALDITSLAKKWGNIGRTTMYRSLKRHKFSYKKNLGYIKNGTSKLAKNTAKK